MTTTGLKGASAPQQSAPTLGQPVIGQPFGSSNQQPGTGVNMVSQGQYGSGAQFQSPSANPYNLPSDLVGGQPQGQQFNGLLQQFEDARNTANANNESRYSQALEGYQQLEQDYSQRTQDLMGNLGNFGAAQNQQLDDKFQQERAGLTQDMINRGLYNTSSLDQARQGLSAQQQRQQLQLDDMLMRQRMDYQRGITGEELANRPRSLEFIERRNDTGPSYESLAGLSGAVGASQAGVPDYASALGSAGGAVSVGRPQAPSGTGLQGSPTEPTATARYNPRPLTNATNINVARGTRGGPTGSIGGSYGGSSRYSGGSRGGYTGIAPRGGGGGGGSSYSPTFGSRSSGAAGGLSGGGGGGGGSRSSGGGSGAIGHVINAGERGWYDSVSGQYYQSMDEALNGGGPTLADPNVQNASQSQSPEQSVLQYGNQAGLSPEAMNAVAAFLTPYMSSGATLKDLSYDAAIRSAASNEVNQVLAQARRS